MSDHITTTGIVATPPKHIVTSEGLAITSFRLAAVQRRFNKAQGSWENGETNWFNISAFRHLAMNLAASLSKGDRVVVTGRLRVRRWEAESKSGLVVEIDADAVGHDLNWGTATYTRTPRAGDVAAPFPEAAERGFVPDDAGAPSEAWAPSDPGAAMALA
jgi:single-strand DNA-binding protein